jgi:hypothetical protein
MLTHPSTHNMEPTPPHTMQRAETVHEIISIEPTQQDENTIYQPLIELVPPVQQPRLGSPTQLREDYEDVMKPLRQADTGIPPVIAKDRFGHLWLRAKDCWWMRDNDIQSLLLDLRQPDVDSMKQMLRHIGQRRERDLQDMAGSEIFYTRVSLGEFLQYKDVRQCAVRGVPLIESDDDWIEVAIDKAVAAKGKENIGECVATPSE